MSQLGFACRSEPRPAALQPRLYRMANARVTLQPRQFRISNVHRTRIIPSEQRIQVEKTFRELLGFDSVEMIKGQLDSIVRALGNCSDLVLEEKRAVVGLEELHKRNSYCRCEPVSFIKEYDPLIKSLEEACKSNHKSLTCFETGLLLHYSSSDPLLLAVYDLHERIKSKSKEVAQIVKAFKDYSCRFEIEVPWMSSMAKRLEGNNQLFAMIVSKITDLQSKVLGLIEIFNDLPVYTKDSPKDFNIQTSGLHTLVMILESVGHFSKVTSWVEDAVLGLCFICNNARRLLFEKSMYASRFRRIEQTIMNTSPNMRQLVAAFEQEVHNIRKSYNEKMSRLTKDGQGPEAKNYIFKKVKDNTDFSWRCRLWNGRNILPTMRNQKRGKCAYVSTTSCTESLYKRKHTFFSTVGGKSYQPEEFILELSPDHLEDIVVAFLDDNPKMASKLLDVCLERMKTEGVTSEEAYKDASKNFEHYQRYRIKEFESLNIANLDVARGKLNNGIALIGNFKITKDFLRLKENDIYEIQKGADYETNIAGQTCSHCVVIVGYGTTPEGLSYYIFQNSYGEKWGSDGGYGRVACSSLKYLYSANV